jgi:hypothetical protein
LIFLRRIKIFEIPVGSFCKKDDAGERLGGIDRLAKGQSQQGVGARARCHSSGV